MDSIHVTLESMHGAGARPFLGYWRWGCSSVGRAGRVLPGVPQDLLLPTTEWGAGQVPATGVREAKAELVWPRATETQMELRGLAWRLLSRSRVPRQNPHPEGVRGIQGLGPTFWMSVMSTSLMTLFLLEDPDLELSKHR